MATDLSKLAFDSRLNYLKRSEFSGEGEVTQNPFNEVLFEVTHSLGYVPFFIAGCDINDDGIIWSNEYVHEFTQSSGTSTAPKNYFYWCDDTELTILVRNDEGSNITRKVYYVVYLDYSS